MPDVVKIVWNRAPAIGAMIEKAAAAGCLKAAQEVAASAQTEIKSGPKTGHLYGGHQASAPGEAPAIITGDLFAGISARLSPEDGPTSAVAESTDEKSVELEYGGLRFAPRPFLGPAAEAIRPDLARIVAAEISRQIGVKVDFR